MQKIVHLLAEKYAVSSVLTRLEELANSPTIRIGFIGEFSAGKSSLINSILDIHLPTDIKPTTKAICIVEPTVGIEKNMYFKEENDQRTAIDFAEFRDILRGEKEVAAAIIQVPPSKVLPSGCVFVDTPGIHTATGSEADLTYSYLALLDAAVVCINITDGIISKNLLDFICSNQLRHLQKHMVFAITWSDRKSPEEGGIVKQAIVELLKKTVSEGNLDMDRIEDKVFTVSSIEQGNAAKIYEILKDAVLEDTPALHEQRKNYLLRGIANDLVDILTERQKMATFNSSQIEEEIAATRKEILTIQAENNSRERRMNEFAMVLRSKVENVLRSHLAGICAAGDEASQAEAIAVMNNQLAAMLENETKTYLGISVFSEGYAGDIGMKIAEKMKRISQIRDVSVMALTAVATAWICPGASLAVNAGEAAGGAAVAAVGKAGKAASAASKAASAANKAASAANTASKVASGAAKAGKAAGTFGKVIGVIGTVLHDINPLEHIGDFVAGCAKQNLLEQVVTEKSATITGGFINALEEPFQCEIMQPLMDKLAERQKQLKVLAQKSDSEFAQFRNECSILEDDIANLKKSLEK